MHLRKVELRLRISSSTGRDYFCVHRASIIAGALKTLLLLLVITLSISSTTFAKQPKKTFLKVLEADPLSVSVSLGKKDNSHQRYAIIDSTKVTIDGVSMAARDLRAGMVAAIEASADGKSALIITAKDAPRHPRRHRVG